VWCFIVRDLQRQCCPVTPLQVSGKLCNPRVLRDQLFMQRLEVRRGIAANMPQGCFLAWNPGCVSVQRALTALRNAGARWGCGPQRPAPASAAAALAHP